MTRKVQSGLHDVPVPNTHDDGQMQRRRVARSGRPWRSFACCTIYLWWIPATSANARDSWCTYDEHFRGAPPATLCCAGLVVYMKSEALLPTNLRLRRSLIAAVAVCMLLEVVSHLSQCFPSKLLCFVVSSNVSLSHKVPF